MEHCHKVLWTDIDQVPRWNPNIAEYRVIENYFQIIQLKLLKFKLFKSNTPKYVDCGRHRNTNGHRLQCIGRGHGWPGEITASYTYVEILLLIKIINKIEFKKKLFKKKLLSFNLFTVTGRWFVLGVASTTRSITPANRLITIPYQQLQMGVERF